MPQRMVRTTLPETLPVSLKSLSVDGQGRLSQRRAVGPLFFAFSHDGRRYECRFTERGGRAVIVLDRTLGRLDGLSPEGRRAVRRIVRAARAEGVSLILRRDGRLDLSHRLRPAPPVAAHILVGALATALLQARPWLALAEETLAGAAAQA